MKKLLAILTAVGLSVSAGASVISCSVAKIKDSMITEFLGEISRASYLNSKYGYDMNYMIDTNLYKNNDENVKKLEENFGGQLFANNLELKNVSLERGKLPGDNETLINTFNVISKVLKLDSNENKSQQLKELIENSISMLGIELNEEAIKDSQTDLETTAKLLEEFGSGMDLDKYSGYDWNTAFQKCLVNWAKAISGNAGVTIQATDFAKIMDEMSGNIKGNFNFEYLFSNDAMPAFIDFAKLVLVYLSELISNYDIKTSPLTTQEIKNLRSNTIDNTLNINLKKMLVEINDALFGLNSKTTGPIALENILTALLLDTEKEYKTDPNAETFLINKIMSAYSHSNTGNIGISKFGAALLNSVIDLDLGGAFSINIGDILINLLETISSGTPIMPDGATQKVDGFEEELPVSEAAIRFIFTLLLDTSLPPQLDPVINSLASLLVSETPLKILYDENVLGDVLFLLAGINGDFSLEGILTGSLSELLGISEIFGFDLTGDFSSIKGIVNLIVNNLDDGELILDIDKLGKILEKVSELLRVLPPNIDAILKWLEDDGDGVIDDLYDVMEQMQGLDGLLEYLINASERLETQLIQRTTTDFKNIAFSVNIDGDKYTYEIEQSTIIIVLTNENKYKRISKITVI